MAVSDSVAIERYGFFVDGEARSPRHGEHFDSIDPTTGRVWAHIAAADSEDVDDCVRSAKAAFDGSWGEVAASERGLLLFRLADAIDAHAEPIAALETRENGKLYREMLAQMKLVPKWLRYFGGQADKIEGSTIPLDRMSIVNYTVREPLGVVGVIMPWNSPAFLSMMAVAPALAAGNTVVVKPSEVTSTSMLEVARLATEVGMPPGVLNVVTGLGPVGEALVRHPDVAKISVTGGIETGRAIGVAAADRLAKFTLELGGKSANIVFGDADVDAAEAGLLAGIFGAAGQTCVAGSRAFIHESIFDDLLDRIAGRARSVRLETRWTRTPNGSDRHGRHWRRSPPSSTKPVRRVLRWSPGAGAPGRRAARTALFYEPTVVRDAAHGGHLAQTEVFGPVLAVFPFSTEEEVVELSQRHPLRPCRRRVDERRQPGPSGGRRARSGHGVGQHVPRDGPPITVRRLQGERHRPPERQ